MYQTAQPIYVWIKSDDGKRIESHRVQGWKTIENHSKQGWKWGSSSPELLPLIFDENEGLRYISQSEAVRFSLDERDQQPLMIRSNSPVSPSAPTSAVSVSTLPLPNGRIEFETEHSRRVKANALPHERDCFRNGAVEA